MTVVIGLTGGIASGKSTVSNMFRDLNIPVIDADVAARDVVRVGEEAYHKIVSTFGKEILKSDGTIDRQKLGSIVFHNKEKRLLLNQIVHPAIRSFMAQQKESYIKDGHKVVVMDIPLLYESKLMYLVDKTLLVFVSEEVQLERLKRRNQLTNDEAQARINSQMPLKEKVRLADAVLDNNGTISYTRQQLYNILKEWGIEEYIVRNDRE